jgi:hypothetical protein
MSQSNYITCACQNCNGHIKFDADELKIGETRRIECPHCHLETVIFNKPGDTNANPSIETGTTIPHGKKLKSSKIELFLFELTRFPTIAGAILVLLAFIITAILVVQTQLPEKPPKTPVVSYEMVAPAPAITPNTQKNEEAYVSPGAKMASKNSFPQPVIDFLLKHQGFTLKEWLNQLNPEQRQAFLKNLAIVLVSANANDLTADSMEQVVKDFAELWITTLKDDATARAEKMMEKQQKFSQLTTVAFGLFLSLMILCLVLVLLAIERNTRLNAKPKESK